MSVADTCVPNSSPSRPIRVIGGGLAGCEAAWQLAAAGYTVELVEMKPMRRTPAQHSDRLAELVCSNSFRSASLENAVGVIKEEMRRAGSLVMSCAARARVPAGDALAVDREHFSSLIEAALQSTGRVGRVGEEALRLPRDGGVTLVCTGPLTSDALAADIAAVCGRDRLAFYDAIAPIVDAESIDLEHAFFGSRYGKGEGSDYLNCPMTREEFETFHAALLAADQVSAKEFEDLHYFEGCLPIEVLASRGPRTLTFGPMKPVGLEHPETGKRAWAVLQLRKEDIHGSAYNLVGCQTRLRQPAQREVFGMIPALRNARFLRFGAIHRNTYLDAPALLDERGALRAPPDDLRPAPFFAGQITGVEGYVESTASGLLTAWLVIDLLQQRALDVPPGESALGGLYRHVRGSLRADPDHYGPSNVTWAMVPPLEGRIGKRDRKRALAERALHAFDAWLERRREEGRHVGPAAAGWAPPIAEVRPGPETESGDAAYRAP